MALEPFRYTDKNDVHKVGDMWEDDDGRIRIAKEVVYGSTIISPQRKASARAYFANRAERWGNKSDLGNFLFAHLSADYSPLSDQTLARLVYLATYIKRGTTQLYRARKPIKYCDLPAMLGLSQKTVDRLTEEAKDFINVSEEGYVSVLGDVLTCGKLKKNEFVDLQMLYCETIQHLYIHTPKSKHALLGMFFRLLPYVNHEYNVLCQNPYEEDIDSIIPLSLKDFCSLAGYNYSKISVLRKELKKLTFAVGGKQELFCSFVDAGLGAERTWVFVNPHILYSGTDYKKVEVLGKFCEL